MGKIIIPPRDRVDWHGQMAVDCRLSHVGFRVGCLIGLHFNNETGETFVGLDHIANAAGISRRTAWAAVEDLARLGHLKVIKGGGRNVANTYAMVLTPQNGATRCTVCNTETVQNRAREAPQNGAMGCTPTLTLDSYTKKNSAVISSFQDGAWGGKRVGAGRKGYGERRQVGRGKQATFAINSVQFEAWIGFYEDIGDHRRVSLMRAHAERSRWGTWAEETEWPPAVGTPDYRRRANATALAKLHERTRDYDDPPKDNEMKDVTPSASAFGWRQIGKPGR